MKKKSHVCSPFIALNFVNSWRSGIDVNQIELKIPYLRSTYKVPILSSELRVQKRTKIFIIKIIHSAQFSKVYKGHFGGFFNSNKIISNKKVHIG